MEAFTTFAALFLLLSVLLGMRPVTRGRTAAEKMLAIMLLGSTGCGLSLLLSRTIPLEAAVDLALVLALLAAVVGVAFVVRDTTQTTRNPGDG